MKAASPTRTIDSEILTVNHPQESLQIKKPTFDNFASPVTLKRTRIQFEENISENTMNNKSIKTFTRKTKNIRPIFALRDPENHDPIALFRIMNIVKDFVNFLKQRIFAKNFTRLKNEHLTIIDDLSVENEQFLKFCKKSEITESSDFAYYSKKTFKLQIISSFFFQRLLNKIIAIKRRVLGILFSIGRKIDGLFPSLSINSKSVLVWDLLILFHSIFFVLLIPLELSFDFLLFSNEWFGHLLSFFIIFLFAVDIFLSLHKGYYNNGTQILNRSSIILNYFKKRFIFDILALFGFIYFYSDPSSIIKILILFKIFFIEEFFSYLEEKLTYSDLGDSLIHLFQLFMKIIFTAHILACILHSIGFYNEYRETWISTNNLTNEKLPIKYVNSLYWAITTLSTVGYGDITPQNTREQLVCMGVMLMGCGFFAYSINTFGYILGELSRRKKEENKEIKVLNAMMRKKNLTWDLQNKVRNYYKSLKNEENSETLDQEKEVFKKLSKELQKEVILNSNAQIIKQSKLFCNNFTEDFLQKICFYLKPLNFGPEEIIFDEYSTNPSIFFVIKGEIACFKTNLKRINDDVILFKIKDKDTLGDYNFFTSFKYEYSAKSIGYSRIFSLSRKDFLTVLNTFPEDKQTFHSIKDHLLFNNNIKILDKKCKLCKSSHHNTYECPFINIQTNKNKILYKLMKANNMNQANRIQKIRSQKKKRMVYIRNLSNHEFVLLKTFETLRDFAIDRERGSNKKFKKTKSMSSTMQSPKSIDINLDFTKTSKSDTLIEEAEKISENHLFNETLDGDELEHRKTKSIKISGSNSFNDYETMKTMTNMNKILLKKKLFDFDFETLKNYEVYFPHNNFISVLKKRNFTLRFEKKAKYQRLIKKDTRRSSKKKNIFKLNEAEIIMRTKTNLKEKTIKDPNQSK